MTCTKEKIGGLALVHEINPQTVSSPFFYKVDTYVHQDELIAYVWAHIITAYVWVTFSIYQVEMKVLYCVHWREVLLLPCMEPKGSP